MNFRMPDSYYDPPEDALIPLAETIDSKDLHGIYELDEDGNPINYDERIPDFYGNKSECEAMLANNPDRDEYAILPLTFDTCYALAEHQAWNDKYDYDDYKYDVEKESQPDDYEDYEGD